MRLLAAFCPDLLGELTTLPSPQTPSWIKGGEERNWKREREGRGRKEERGWGTPAVCSALTPIAFTYVLVASHNRVVRKSFVRKRADCYSRFSHIVMQNNSLPSAQRRFEASYSDCCILQFLNIHDSLAGLILNFYTSKSFSSLNWLKSKQCSAIVCRASVASLWLCVLIARRLLEDKIISKQVMAIFYQIW